MYIQCICMYVYILHIYNLFKKAHLHTNEMGACLFLHTELNLGWRFYATRDKSIFSIFHSGYFDFIIASAENASSHNSTVQHGRSVFKALSENGWKFYPSLKPKIIEQFFFFCKTPISNTNSTFFFCFVFCSLCYIVSLWEQETLYHREVLQLQSSSEPRDFRCALLHFPTWRTEQYKTTWHKGEGCQKHLGLVFYFELIFCHFMSRNL